MSPPRLWDYIAASSLTPGGAGATNQLIVFTLP
jgi:hypothetical protein